VDGLGELLLGESLGCIGMSLNDCPVKQLLEFLALEEDKEEAGKRGIGQDGASDAPGLKNLKALSKLSSPTSLSTGCFWFLICW